ncbi:MAG: hypothetical protein O2955_00685 [Planctomycetota bacterium]|nr:hypothetical protein [Planctomycetota bacterium]MDA1210997.1 hypothetical protein [Planctomycetota bacterium]
MSKGRIITARRVVFWGPATILAILYFFGHELGFFPGGHPQTSTDNNPPVETTAVDETTVKIMTPESNSMFQSLSNGAKNSDGEDTKSDDSSSASSQPHLLRLLTDDRNYLVAADSSSNDAPLEWQPINLSEIVKRAEIIKPNEAGLRVLISRRGSSRVSTEMELLEALHQAGITDDEIHIEEKLIP